MPIFTGTQNNDTLTGTDGDDTIYGGNSQDVLAGLEGNDTIFGGDGDDSLYGGAGNDSLNGGAGQDRIYGGDGDDDIDTGDTANNKSVDTVYGGDGNDTIRSSGNQDQLFGGADSDRFIVVSDGSNFNNLTVNGGEDADGLDNDVLDLRALRITYPNLHITYESGSEGTEDGRILVRTSQNGNELGRITYTGIENIVICFTPGTAIATPKGEVAVETLRAGDRVFTRDNGIQEIAWVGHRVMNAAKLIQAPHLRPVAIKAGALGNGIPERDLLLSPNHRVMMATELTQLYFEESEVLASAKHLIGAKGIATAEVSETTYIHFMCARHEVVLANGAWTESFQPGDHSLKGIDIRQRQEIMKIFPELATHTGLEDYPSARKTLKKHEVKLLIR